MESGRFEIMEDLCRLDLGQRFDRLEFNDDRAVADEINAIPCSKGRSFVKNWNLLLASEGDVAAFELKFEGFALDRFQETGAQFTVDLHGGADVFVGIRVSLCESAFICEICGYTPNWLRIFRHASPSVSCPG